MSKIDIGGWEGRKGSNGRMRGSEGSVSVFLIMALAFVFLFTAVLIDFARIAAANVQEERLARAGVRSVMSSYDTVLRENYGLFAFSGNGGDGTRLLSEALNGNLYESGRGDAFNLLPVKLDSSSLSFSRTIGSYDVFQRQIIEEMKYKAPVDFALELAKLFKPLSGAMTEASSVTKVLAKLQPLYDEREAALDLMLKRRIEAAESSGALQTLIMDPPGDSIGNKSLGTVAATSDIAAMYDDYVSKYEADLNRKEGKPKKYTAAIQKYLSQSAAVREQISPSLASFQMEHDKLLAEAEAALKRASELNEQMSAVMEQARNSGEEAAAEAAKGWDIPGSTGELDADPLRQLRDKEDQLIMSSAEFEVMTSSLAAQVNQAPVTASEIAALPQALSAATGTGGDSGQMKAAVLQASNALEEYLQSYGQSGSIIVSEKQKLEARRTEDGTRKELEQQAQAKLNDAMQMVEKLQSMGDGVQEAFERFGTLRQYNDEIIAYNQGLGSEVTAGAADAKDPYAAGSSAMQQMDGLYGSIGSIMEGARDRLYQTEYAALYFPHTELSQFSPLSSGASPADLGQTLVQQLDPHAQELEYILYGIHHPAGNVSAAYGEIFAMRLAVRTMEGLMESSKFANPLAILAAALLYGVEHAVADMAALCNNGEIPLSKYVQTKLSYRDHLRLFMVLHGGGESQLSRMLALIRLNTGIDPIERYTYASAEITMGLRLWFLPGVVKLVNYTASLPGDIRDKVYYKTVQADYAY